MQDIKRTPLSKLSDKKIEEIRTFRGLVNNLKLYRAKGFCEICNQPFGVFSLRIDGHHIIQPSKYNGNNPNLELNIVICCDYCYKTKVLTGDRSWINNIYRIRKHTADDSFVKLAILHIKDPEWNTYKLIGFKFKIKNKVYYIGIHYKKIFI